MESLTCLSSHLISSFQCFQYDVLVFCFGLLFSKESYASTASSVLPAMPRRAPNLIAIEFETFREHFLTELNLNLFLGADLNTCDVVLVPQLVEDGDTLGELVLDLPPENG